MRMATVTKTEVKGKVVQVQGAVVDVEFPSDQLPAIYEELRLHIADTGEDLSLEVEQHMGNNWTRCIAMGATDGLQRGTEVTALGRPISVPVGPKTLGRIFNVLGQTVDNRNQ
jgi:F-type H+-transporting ATPase subunit beta